MIVSRQKGLALVELLIVLLVLGVLAGIAIPKFTSAKEHALDAAAMSDVRSAMRVVQEYESNHMQYPATMEDAGFRPSEGVEFTKWSIGNANGTPYILLEAGHGSSSVLYYSFFPVQGDLRKRDRGSQEPQIDELNPSESVGQ